MPDKKYTRQEFASRIKEKYPSYGKMEDSILVDKILTKYPQYKDQIAEGNVDAPGDGASTSEATSSELSVEEHNARADAIKSTLFVATPQIPEFLQEPMAAFIGTVGSIATGSVQALEQAFYQRAQQLVEKGEIEATDEGRRLQTIRTDEELDKMKPEERLQVFEEWSLVGDDMEEAVSTLHDAQKIYGTGSISKELAEGNLGNAARITANQSAAGLASLVPFALPGGQVLGPALLGGSVVGSEFKEGLKREGATMHQIRTASYAKGANEFAWELVTAGIIGKARKLAAGGASRQAVRQFTEAAWKSVGIDMFKEGVSEGFTDTGNRIIDHFVFGDEWDGKAALVGWVDSSIIGAIVGGKVSTYGQIAHNNVAKDIAANALKTDAQKEADLEDLKIIEDAKLTQHKDTEGSLVDQVVQQEAADQANEALDRIKTRQEKHKKTLEDMTKEELQKYADAKDKADKLEAEKKKLEKEEKTVPDAIEDKINEHRTRQAEQYGIVESWREIKSESDRVIKENKEAIEKDEAALKDAAQPQETADGKPKKKTAKQKLSEKQAKQRIRQNKKNIEKVEKTIDNVRPKTADAKTRKKLEAQKKKLESLKTKHAQSPQKLGKETRTELNKGLIEVITDPSIPDSQKQKPWADFFKTNAGLITNIAKQIAGKTSGDFNVISDYVKSEVVNQINKKGKLDNKVWNNAQKAAERAIIKEQQAVREQTVLKEDQAELDEEIAYLNELADQGVLEPDQLQEEIDNVKQKYSVKPQKTSLDVVGEGGETQIKTEVEKAVAPEESFDELAKLQQIIKDAGGVDALVDSLDTDKIFALLPQSAKTGKAFSGIFQDGNPALEIWESYFDSSDRQGKDRVRQLKKAVQKRIDEASGPQIDSSDISPMEATKAASSKNKTKVQVLLPLLAKLKKAFPGTKIIISKARMIEDFIEAGIDPAKAENIKGYTDGNVVVLNPDKLDVETPIHEFGHLWAQATRSERPELYQKGVELIKKSPYWLELLEKRDNQPDSVYYGYSDARLLEEAIATAIGQQGAALFETAPEQSAWDNLRTQIMEWLSQKLGVAKIEDLTLDQFLKIANTEILTGEKVIKPEDVLETEQSLVTEFLEVPVGTTRDYSPTTKPMAEIDTHGAFKGGKLSAEVDGVLQRLNNLEGGGYLLWTTGSYGSAVPQHKRNPKLNSRIEAKVNGMKKYLAGKGFTLKQDPKNPGTHIVKKSFSFLEEDVSKNTNNLEKAIEKKIKNILKPYKTPSPYKYSRVNHETKNVLKSTLADIQKRSGTLTHEQLSKLDALVDSAVVEGKELKSQQKKRFAGEKAEVQGEVKEMVKDLSGVDPDNVEAANLQARKRDSWLSKLKSINLLANILSPATNNDFYGLLYDLLPAGKNRLRFQKFLKETLIDPLEKANVELLNAKRELRNNWINSKVVAITGKTSRQLGIKGTKKALEQANALLNARSTVEYGGEPLSNSDVIKIYNYLKDPSTYRQVESTLSSDKLNDVIAYVKENPQLKDMADRIPGVYAGVAGRINSKLDQHGRETFDRIEIKPENLTAEQLDRLEQIYGSVSAIPKYGEYTPMSAISSEQDAIDVDALIKGDSYTAYTVMDGRLKKRTRGGTLKLHADNLDADFKKYLDGPVRTMAFLDFAKNASNVFGPKQMAAMKASLGNSWASAMKDSLSRIVTGKTTPTYDNAETRLFDKWINRTVGTVMTLNLRSGLLQLISTANYWVADPVAWREGARAPSSVKNEVKEFIKNSEWYAERGRGQTDVALDALFDDTSPGVIDEILQKGYVFTKGGDKLAILWGGSKLMTGKYMQYQKDGLSKEEAMQRAYQDFISKTEESQQSTRQERLGQTQSTRTGKLLLAFANTPMQYNRIMSRALKDLRGLRGVNTEAANKRKAEARKQLVYYGALQNVIFNTLQSLTLPGVSGDVDDEALDLSNKILDTLLRGIGVWGAVASGVKNALIDTAREKPNRVINDLINISPAIGTKVRHVLTALKAKPIYAQSELIDDAMPYQIASGINAATNVPADRILKIFEQVGDAFSSDFEWYQGALRALGWSRYDLDEPAGKALK